MPGVWRRVSLLLAAVGAALRHAGDANDLLHVVGVSLAAYGCWLAWEPLGFIVAGLLLLAGGVLGVGDRGGS
jgi:uncharacterized membrane protein YhhN